MLFKSLFPYIEQEYIDLVYLGKDVNIIDADP